MEEIWKDVIFKENNKIFDYFGLYQISNLGRIKYLPKKAGVHNRKEKISIGYKDKNGYLRAYLCKNNKIKTIGMHKLVALMFMPNPYQLTQINHKDEDKENNKVDNLEWCTCKYNINYGTRNKRVSEKLKKQKSKIVM